jgi:hypothetical protein
MNAALHLTNILKTTEIYEGKSIQSITVGAVTARVLQDDVSPRLPGTTGPHVVRTQLVQIIDAQSKKQLKCEVVVFVDHADGLGAAVHTIRL